MRQSLIRGLAVLLIVWGGQGLPCASAEDEVPAAPAPSPPVAPPAEPALPPPASDSLSTRFDLHNGFRLESGDQAFKLHLGGRLDWDSGWYNVPPLFQKSLGDTPLQPGTDMRRFRFGADGTVWEQVDFAIEADFSKAADFKGFQATPQTNIFITNAWVGTHGLPILDVVKAGHQKEYLTFSNATSAKFLPFMERPYIFDAYENDFSYDSGISTSRTYFDEHMTSWVGAFWNGTRSQAFNVGGRYGASGRLTWMPIYDDSDKKWLNFGVSASTRAFQDNDPNVVTVRPLVRTGESFQVPNLLNSGALQSDNGLQIAGVGAHSAWGPFTVGSEFLCWSIRDAFRESQPSAAVGDLLFTGWYLEALWFLTPGDHRPVDRVTPGYARVQPVRNFLCKRDSTGNWVRGSGAVEVGVRYDHVDVNSGLVQAGTLDSITLGLNWYLNPNARITTNYVYTTRDTITPGASGQFNALGVRFHFDF